MEEVAAVRRGDDRWKARGAMHSWLCGILRGVKTPDLQQLLRRSTAGAPSRGVRCLEGVKKVVIMLWSLQDVYARLWCARELHPTPYVAKRAN